MKHISAYLSILLFFCAAAAPATPAQTLHLGYVEFEPVTYTDSQGKPAGLLLEASAKIIEKAGFDWTAQSLPAKRMARMIAKGHLHLWVGLSTLPEFKGTTLVSKTVKFQHWTYVLW